MIYIAGKISGLNIEDVEAKFNDVESQLHLMGLKVINPLKLGIRHLPYEAQMEECFKVIEKNATAIYMLNGWKNSEGANEN